MSDDAYLIRDRGRKAREKGLTHLDNPWDPREHPQKHQWWLEGWSWEDVRPPAART